ncbi:MAG: hypothetical protein GDA56_04990 [Hormoscilla sp. GM7CHS1pb]|nr:hypothetical protein [Hormoscilla sp. GM7CHS1pb]
MQISTFTRGLSVKLILMDILSEKIISQDFRDLSIHHFNMDIPLAVII